MPTYKLIDVGRGKFNGEVETPTDHPEHVEAFVLREAKKYLASREVHLSGDNETGLILAGMRPVGRYERKGNS